MCFGTVEASLLTFRFDSVSIFAIKTRSTHETIRSVVCVKYSKLASQANFQLQPQILANGRTKTLIILLLEFQPFLITKMESVKTGRTTGKMILDLSDPTRSARRSKILLNPCNPYCMVHCGPNDGFSGFPNLGWLFGDLLMSRNAFSVV